MFIYSGKFCQLIFPFLLILAGCAGRETAERNEIYRAINALPYWHKVDDRFVAKGPEGEIPLHPFFDLAPFVRFKDHTVNVYVINPARQESQYQMDLLTGKLFKERSLCPQKDVWGKYKSKIHLAPYSLGIIPRLLDPWGMPQQVLLFGREEFYKQNDPNVARSIRVKIVGGIIDQYCKKIPCTSRYAWDSHLLLVAVDPNDGKFSQVQNLQDLKSKIDWEEVMAFIQNGRGRKLVRDLGVATYRTVGEVSKEKAFNYALKTGHYFKFEEMKSLRTNCQKLYDYLWESSQMVRKQMGEKKKDEKLSNFIKKFEATNVVQADEFFETKQEIVTKDFVQFFNDFYKRFGDRFYTCSRLVPYSNINFEQNRHWFLTYMVLYYKLENMGYIYSCGKRSWLENPKKLDNTWTFDPAEERGRCTVEDLDRAFDNAVTKMATLQQANEEHYRYIDYDNRPAGTHQKIHSWVNVTGKSLKCEVSDSEKSKWNALNDNMKIFLENVFWTDFSLKNEVSDRELIIR